MKRVFLIHGWTGSSNKDWFPWAKRELQKKGYEVYVPEMSDTNYPKIKPWLDKLQEVVGKVRPNDILVGHSLGANALLRFLETFSSKAKVDKVILIAAASVLSKTALPLPEDNVIFKPWGETPIDFKKVKKMANSFTAVYAKDDPWVPMKENIKLIKEKLSPKVIIKESGGHFTAEEGSRKLPFLLELIK